MRNKRNVINIDNSDPTNYPDGRIKDDPGNGTGTPVNEYVYGDIHENLAKVLRLYGIGYNSLPDNEENGYQLVEGLRALATKNDFILELNTQDNIVRVNLKLNYIVIGEFFIVRSTFDYTPAMESIKGTDNSISAFVTTGFKVGDYIQITKTANGWIGSRLINSDNLSVVNAELGFLKAATNDQDLAGEIDTVSTTPSSQKATFTNRVIGAGSADFLATRQRNGLYPKEHFQIVADMAAPLIKNIGGFSGFDINGGSIGFNYTVFGDVISATLDSMGTNTSIVRVTLRHEMDNTNYYVKSFLESNGNRGQDTGAYSPMFRVLSKTQFEFMLKEPAAVVHNLKIHFEVTQIR